jgi:hypothetical protein
VLNVQRLRSQCESDEGFMKIKSPGERVAVLRVARNQARSRNVRPLQFTTFETLESRLLFTTYSDTVTSGHTSVYLKPGPIAGQVQVRLDSPIGTVDHTFTNTTGMDIIDFGSTTNFTCFDQVSAALKPASDGTHSGTKVQGGSSGTLEVDAGVADTLIEVTSSLATSATISVTDASDSPAIVGLSRFGNGVNHLVLRTNNVDAGDYYPNGGTEVNVPALASATFLRIETGSGTYDAINLGGGEDASVSAIVHTGAGHDLVSLQQDDDSDGNTSAVVDFDPGLGSELGSGNALYIGGYSTSGVFFETVGFHCSARLESTGHIGTLDSILVGHTATLIVADESIVGDIHLLSFCDASIEAPLTLSASASTTGTLTVDSESTVEFTGASAGSSIATVSLHQGILTLDAATETSVGELNVVSTGVVNANSGAGLAIDTATNNGILDFNLVSVADVSVETFNNTGQVNISDGGEFTVTAFHQSGAVDVKTGAVVTVTSFDGTGTLNIDAALVSILHSSVMGSLNITNSGRATLAARAASSTARAANARYLDLDNLNLGSVGSEVGILDMNDNNLVVTSGDFMTIFGYMIDGYSGGVDLMKKGIISTTGQTVDGGAALLSLSDNAVAGFTNFPGTSGHAVGSNAILGKYTYVGDTNWDGMVTPQDYTATDSHLGESGVYLGIAWFYGDTNFDGSIDPTDYAGIDGALGLGVGNPL